MTKRREDDQSSLLQLIREELREMRNQQRKINDMLTPLIHEEAIQKEIDHTFADFDDKEDALINYVKSNPGQSKRKIAEEFDLKRKRLWRPIDVSPCNTRKN